MVPSKKAYVEDWVFEVPDTFDLILPEDQEDLVHETSRVTLPVPSSHREAPKLEVSASTQEHNEAPLPQLPSRPTCERLELPFSDDDHLVRLRGPSPSTLRSIYHVGYKDC